MKRRELESRIRQATRRAGVDCEFYELSRHRGVRVGSVRTTIPRHVEIPDRLTEAIFKQLESELGRGWWR